MKITKKIYGKLWNSEAALYTLESDAGMSVSITDYGGIITHWNVPAPDGNVKDIALGFDTFGEYLAGHPFFGAIAGRFANRIRSGRFTLNGTEYQLAAQAGGQHLHGGIRGFDKYIWQSRSEEHSDSVSLVLELISPDGDEGYPGTLNTKAVYTVFRDNKLQLDFSASTDKSTIINLTNHTYFNLAGHNSGDTRGQKITIFADSYLPVDDVQIPTGELAPVDGTFFDCRKSQQMGDMFDKAPDAVVDHCYVISENPGMMKKAAVAEDPVSGRTMTVFTDNAGMQFYNGNKLASQNTVGKGGFRYGDFSGFCLETQCFPDSPNQKNFPSCVLNPKEKYTHSVIYQF